MQLYRLLPCVKTVLFSFVLLSLAATAPVLAGTPVLRPVPASETSSVIKDIPRTQDAYTIVFIFASWCPVCKQNFPVLEKVASRYKGKGLDVIALSVDQDKQLLSRYLASYEKLSFPAYYVMQSYSGELQRDLLTSGIRYNGSIPFIALLDKDGKVMGQGNYSVASVEKVLEKLIPEVN